MLLAIFIDKFFDCVPCFSCVRFEFIEHSCVIYSFRVSDGFL